MAGIGGWVGAPARASAELLVGSSEPAVWRGEGASLAWAARRTCTRGGLGLASDDTYVLAFDGVLTARAALVVAAERQLGHAVPAGDAALLLTLWRALGEAALDRLEGTFALAVYHRARRELTLARDRLGGATLAWGRAGEARVFGSDTAQVAAALEAPRAPTHWLDVLLLGHAPPPATPYRDVWSVEPGHLVRFDAAGTPRVVRYFAPSFMARTDAARQLSTRLVEIVEAHVAEAPSAVVLLDGGVGGAALAHAAGSRWDSCSVVLSGEDPSRDPGVRQARALGTRHHVLTLAPDALDVGALVRAHGGPFATQAPLAAARLVASSLLGEAPLILGTGASTLAGAPPSVVAATTEATLPPRVGAWVRRGSELVADVTLSPLRPWLESVAEGVRAAERPLRQRVLGAEGVLPPELLAEALLPELRPSLFGRTAWSDRALTEASTDTVLGRALARRLRGRVAEELTPAYEHALRRGGATVLWPYFDARWVERATGVLAEQRPAALAALVPAAVPCVADAQEAQLARWMSGPLEPAWRTAVLAERSPLTEVLDVSKLRSSLFAAWNPARGRQALALWTLAAWLAPRP